ncbi:MAG: hypothetical protein EKK35_21860 [Bradyrhizobiaceae bacterium]|jgi:hypothetical protein|nr:MAG: hypothetical protein EKK35_21860 [Bradyrhizobiaceae bacterium]
MRFATLVVEQLDRAATELAVDHPLNARLALILVDNAAELIIQRRCERLVRADRRSGAPTLTAANRRSILGHYFAEKIKFLGKSAALSADERHFIAELHGHRNTLYHVGLKNDDIIRALAVAYFQLTCELLIRFDDRSIGWPKDLVIAPPLHRYFPEAERGLHFPGFDSAHVASELLSRTPLDAPALSAALSHHSVASVDQVEAMFDRIKLGFNRTDDPEDTFRHLQHDMDFQVLVRERMREAGREDDFIPFGHPVLKDFAKKLMPDWKPRHRSLPFAKWRTKAKAIAACADPLSTMRKFTELRGEMEYLAEAIEDAHETFWGWVQQQEDAAKDARR